MPHLLNGDSSFYFRGANEMIKWDILCKAFKIVPKGQYSDSDDNLASLIRDDEYLGQKLVKYWDMGGKGDGGQKVQTSYKAIIPGV